MSAKTGTEKGRCILISLDDNISELKGLARSLEFKVDNVFIQYKKTPDPKFYIGKGKVQEIKDYIGENGIEIVIFNSTLKPSQQYNLEHFFGVTVYDRIRLILEIFWDRAYSEEARLQVELAKYQYEIPLLRDWIHKARYGEKPGFMAGGEYELAQYYEISRRRIKKIKQKLRKVESERDIRRKQRRKMGYHLISIVGYANAGKSTLFNLLAGETVTVEDRPFTTLSTTTRKIPNMKKPIILTDTVGLIDNLPHWLIEAFHSTLEEMLLSDAILLIIDVSEPVPEINRKLKTSFSVLLPDAKPSTIVLVLNKIDRILGQEYDIDREDAIETRDHNELAMKLVSEIDMEHEVDDIIAISAKDHHSKEIVIESILKAVKYHKNLSIMLPNTFDSQELVSWLHGNSEVISIEYGKQIKINLSCREKDEGYIVNRCVSLNGQIL